MRVLHVHNRYRHRGGEDTVVDSERRLLAESGHDVRTVDYENPGNDISAAGSLLLSPWNPVSAVRLRSLAESSAAHIAHVHNTWFSLTPSSVWSLARVVPVVATVHNYRMTCANAMLTRDGGHCELCVEGSAWHGVRYRCYRNSITQSAFAATTIEVNRALKTWHSASLILVVSEFASTVLARAGLPLEKIRVHPNFCPDPGMRAAAPSASNTVLFVGRLSAEKGVSDLLAAWERRSDPSLQLEVIGDGPDRPGLEAMGVTGVRFRGSVTAADVKASMLRARALIFPTRVYEGQPMVVTEALAAGLPVVSTDNDNLRAILQRGAAFGDTHGLSEFQELLTVLDDDRALDQIGRAGRLRYESVYTETAAVERLERLYSEAIGS